MNLMKRILLLVLIVAFCIPLLAMHVPPKKAENKQITATESTDNLNKKGDDFGHRLFCVLC
mgnify:CR=1 FL=1